jgi:hypothetical protein
LARIRRHFLRLFRFSTFSSSVATVPCVASDAGTIDVIDHAQRSSGGPAGAFFEIRPTTLSSAKTS